MEIREMILLIVGLAMSAILVGAVFVTGVGSLANSTKGSACTNCSATTKTLLANTEVFLVIAILLAIIGAGVAAFSIKRARS